MGEAIQTSLSTLFIIGGFLVCFSVLASIFQKIGFTPWLAEHLQSFFTTLGIPSSFGISIATACWEGILEITGGIEQLASASLQQNLILPIVATLLGFGGLSVAMQVASIISHTDLSMKPYWIGKLLHGLFAGLLTHWALQHTSILQAEAVETFRQIAVQQVQQPAGNLHCCLTAFGILISISIVMLLFSKQEKSTKKSAS